jgi:catechol 2,3-dioxygenase-like lactoylglutathione lyase family enzyme
MSPDERQIYKPRSSDVGSFHVGFYVANIDALLARLESVGWPTVGKVQTVESGEREGLRLIYVRGPDGITLEFLQRPEDGPK